MSSMSSFKNAGKGGIRNVRGKHTPNPGYEPFNHWVECESCGFDIRAEDIRETWDGRLVCISDWEPRHPQEFVRTKADTITAKDPVGSPIEVEYINNPLSWPEPEGLVPTIPPSPL